MDNRPHLSGMTSEDPRERQIERWRRLQRAAETFVRQLDTAPPFTVNRLLDMATLLASRAAVRPVDDNETKLLAVMIHNAAWRSTLAAVPYERRLLLLPQCLRTRRDCPADIDAYGLLCRECGRCPLGRLQREALELGYTVLIAEGSSVVTGLLKQGHLDAVIGASCLPALEQSFRLMAEEGIPSLAIPLLRNGCDATDIDLELLGDHLRLRAGTTGQRKRTIDEIRGTVKGWFARNELRLLLDPQGRCAAELAIDCLALDGKRWRPLLTAAVYDALHAQSGVPDLDRVRPVAVAAECFHKASLVHDDIEDNDYYRYGKETLHRAHGIPVALNVGDLLLGEGYRILAGCEIALDRRIRLLMVAADAHRRLCTGQGEELHWRQRPHLLSLPEILAIFELKTAPAFDVAMQFGAIVAGTDETVGAALNDFSRALGVAYQIRDDLQDMEADLPANDRVLQPSVMLALLGDTCSPKDRTALHAHLERSDGLSDFLYDRYRQYGIAETGAQILAEHRDRALRALDAIRSIPLKSMLMRMLRRMLP